MKAGTLIAIAAVAGIGAILMGAKGDEDGTDDGDVGPDIPDQPPGPGPGPLPDVGMDSGMDAGAPDVHVSKARPKLYGTKAKATFPPPSRVKKETGTTVADLAVAICESDDPIQRGRVDLTLGTDLHSAWQPFFGWCLAFVALGNEWGVTPGYYVTLWQHNKDRRYVFGPFSDVVERPGGRPEIDVEDTLRDLLQHGTNYAKAREVK